MDLSSHRAIDTFEQDLLEREAFVKSITRRLISEGRSTGIVLGLVGPWGCGKSSILNLLQNHIENEYRDLKPLIIRFNPWLVSGRNDLLSQFFLELSEALRSHLGTYDVYNDGRQQAQDKAIKAMRDYGDELSPFLRMISPALAAGSNLLTRWSKAQNSISESIFTKRKEAEEGLKSFSFPIIVLIDEMDRIEDDEVREMAKLLKAVGDFDQISYVAAYDEQRVEQALAGKDGDLDRGRAYLEKIVQVRAVAPFLNSEEIENLFKSKVYSTLKTSEITLDELDKKRLAKLLKIVVPRGVQTSRDINRILQDLSGRLLALDGLVNPIDCLAICVLENKKSPAVRQVEDVLLSRNVDVAFDNVSQYASFLEFKSTPRSLNLRYVYLEKGQSWNDHVCNFLWPHFDTVSELDAKPRKDRIYNKSPLIAVLKHDGEKLEEELGLGRNIATQVASGNAQKVFAKGSTRRAASHILSAEPHSYDMGEKQLTKYCRTVARWFEQQCVNKKSRHRVNRDDILTAGCSLSRTIYWSSANIDKAALIARLIEDNSLYIAASMLIEPPIAEFMYRQNSNVSGSKVSKEQIVQLRALFRKKIASQGWKASFEFSGPILFGLIPLSEDEIDGVSPSDMYFHCNNKALLASAVPMLFPSDANTSSLRDRAFSKVFLTVIDKVLLENGDVAKEVAKMDGYRYLQSMIRDNAFSIT
ncbi:KAP family NTPase [Qipengyuania aurantiaca]|uniref:KAP family NTPase n=1 Tax=Qipengyuania aurantiaca TaxID=2867233 RepID=A0ABX8ZK15_9SPHN|nr:P-loop NTPase fold protein [Qipengyuania aurantiaca]QZD89363.1 KAP family NTPase [Qipengyuania aurantiaca]